MGTIGKLMRKLSRIAAIVAATVLAGVGVSTLPAAANPDLGVNYTGGVTAGDCNQQCIDGYEFTVGSAGIKVIDLGAFDGGQGGQDSSKASVSNLNPGEVVDLFSCTNSGCTTGSLLATVNVGGTYGGTQEVNGFFAFNPITALKLSAGNYVVVAADTSTNGDISQGFPPETGSVGAGITYDDEASCEQVGGGFNGSSCQLAVSSLIYSNSNFAQSLLGGNIEYDALPEPASFAIFGTAIFGLGIMGFLRRRKIAA